MATKNQTTVNLTPQARKIRDELSDVFGLKEMLSAGLILFNKLAGDEQIKLIKKIKTDDKPLKNENLHQAIQSVVRIISGSGTDIKILPMEESQLVDSIKKMLGPKEPVVNIKRKKA